MPYSSFDPDVVRISQKGQATIPQHLREKYGIDTPRDVLIYEEDERIIVEPLPSPEDLHGIHAGDHEPDEILAKVRKQKEKEKSCEKEQAERLQPDETE